MVNSISASPPTPAYLLIQLARIMGVFVFGGWLFGALTMKGEVEGLTAVLTCPTAMRSAVVALLTGLLCAFLMLRPRDISTALKTALLKTALLKTALGPPASPLSPEDEETEETSDAPRPRRARFLTDRWKARLHLVLAVLIPTLMAPLAIYLHFSIWPVERWSMTTYKATGLVLKLYWTYLLPITLLGGALAVWWSRRPAPMLRRAPLDGH